MAFRGTRVVVEVGSSGNAFLESTGGPRLDFEPGPGTDVGTRTTGAGDAMELDAQGVVRCCCTRELDDFAVDEASGGNAGAVDEEAAARATRSSICREDCEDDRDEVAFLALSSRPAVIPAHSLPIEVGTSSGNCWRCCKHTVSDSIMDESVK